MTKTQHTTSKAPKANPTEPIVTVNPAGELRCDCRDFRLSALLYPEGWCRHVAAVLTALDKQYTPCG